MTGVPETVFDELKRYVRWGEADEQALRKLHDAAAPQFQRLAEEFYDRILGHEGARTATQAASSDSNECSGSRLSVIAVSAPFRRARRKCRDASSAAGPLKPKCVQSNAPSIRAATATCLALLPCSCQTWTCGR